MKIVPMLWVIIALLTTSKVMDFMTIKKQRKVIEYYQSVEADKLLDRCLEALATAAKKLTEKK